MGYKGPLDERARAARRKHYEANKEQYRARTAAYRAEIQAFLREAKDRPCADCGVQYPFYVMDFDHARGEKECNLNRVGRLGWRRERVEQEIAKCDVVCSNCHRARTWHRASEAEVAGAAPTRLSTGFDS